MGEGKAIAFLNLDVAISMILVIKRYLTELRCTFPKLPKALI